jgi:hypothetical protein
MMFVPPASRSQAIPSRHIPLNEAGETIDAFYRRRTQLALEESSGRLAPHNDSTARGGNRVANGGLTPDSFGLPEVMGTICFGLKTAGTPQKAQEPCEIKAQV